MLLAEGRDVAVRWRDAIPLALWGVPGLALGMWCSASVDKPVLQVAVGLAVVAAAALELRRRAPEPAGARGPPPRWA